MQVPTTDAGNVAGPDHPDVVGSQVIDPCVEVVHLVDHHVPARPPTLGEEPSRRRPVRDRRQHLDELVAHQEQCIPQTELGDTGIVEADLDPERRAQLVDDGIQVRCDERHLPQPDHEPNSPNVIPLSTPTLPR